MAKVNTPTLNGTESYCLQPAVTDPVMDEAKRKPQDLKEPLKEACDEMVQLQDGSMTIITNRRIRAQMNQALDIATKVAGADPIEGEVGDARLKEIAMSQFDAARAKLQNIQEGLAEYEEGKADFKPFDPGEVIQSYYTGVQYQNAYCGTLDDIQSADYDQDLCFKMGEDNPIFEKAERVDEKVNDMTFVPERMIPSSWEWNVAKIGTGQVTRVVGYQGETYPLMTIGTVVDRRFDKTFKQMPGILDRGTLLLGGGVSFAMNRAITDSKTGESWSLKAGNLLQVSTLGGYRQYIGEYFFVQTKGGMIFSTGQTDYGYNASPAPDADALFGALDLGGGVEWKSNRDKVWRVGLGAEFGRSIYSSQDALNLSNFYLVFGRNDLIRDRFANK